MEGENYYRVYGACVRNYGAAQGRYVLDGCGQFAPDAVGSRYCEACGCDKNFHLTIPAVVPAPASSEDSVITLVNDDDLKVKVEVNTTPPPARNNVEDTATSRSKKKHNKNK